MAFPRKSWFKVFYILLLKYRTRQLENFNMDGDDDDPLASPRPGRYLPHYCPTDKSLTYLRQIDPFLPCQRLGHATLVGPRLLPSREMLPSCVLGHLNLPDPRQRCLQ